jgi:hypothetical protein
MNFKGGEFSTGEMGNFHPALTNRSEESVESDFYPYRYLASEGFLPGYNFPRLPLRALIPTGRDVHVIDRPRFLVGSSTETGPPSIILFGPPPLVNQLSAPGRSEALRRP